MLPKLNASSCLSFKYPLNSASKVAGAMGAYHHSQLHHYVPHKYVQLLCQLKNKNKLEMQFKKT